MDEKSIDPKKQLNDFRKLLIVAYVAKRLDVQALSVDFVTERDLLQDRKDKPSLHLGNSMNEVMIRFQSSRVKDKNDIEQFTKEINHFIEKLNGNEDKFFSEAEKLYANIKNELPSGFVQEDLDLMNEVVKQISNKPLFENKELDSLWG